MLASLGDPNTRYLSPENEQAARDAMSGNLHGIGAEVSNQDGALVIVSPYEGSPAEEAGLLPGDILRQANGIVLTGMDVSDAATIVRGPEGTTVDLLIERDGELFEVTVTRGIIQIPSVRGEILEENVAYVRVSRFGNNTSDELEDLLDSLLAEEPAGLVLDLRGNPGGGLTTAVNVADLFLGNGLVLLERFGDGREIQYDADTLGPAEDIPLVILVDQGSASASEVLAGAIRERGRGVIIGTPTFGKGTVQTWRRLSNGGGVRITIARWLTPDGNWVHGKGLDPDFLVALPELDDDHFDDTQLGAAIDYLLGRPVIESPGAQEG